MWTSQIGDLKDNNNTQKQMFGIKTRPIFPKF